MLLKNEIELNTELLEKYSVNIPRYTSYPPAPEWTEKFSKENFLRANEIANKNADIKPTYLLKKMVDKAAIKKIPEEFKIRKTAATTAGSPLPIK